jgi:hypothetical protein
VIDQPHKVPSTGTGHHCATNSPWRDRAAASARERALPRNEAGDNEFDCGVAVTRMKWNWEIKMIASQNLCRDVC